jgi:hypothetical protein
MSNVSSAIQALALFRKLNPGHRKEEVENCVSKGAEFHSEYSKNRWFMVSIWHSAYISTNTTCFLLINCNCSEPIYTCSNRYGSWGVCFTYAAWFGVTGLVCAGRTFENCTAIKKACDFLLSKELPSGGWGESWLSAHNEVSFTSIYRFVHSKKKKKCTHREYQNP